MQPLGIQIQTLSDHLALGIQSCQRTPKKVDVWKHGEHLNRYSPRYLGRNNLSISHYTPGNEERYLPAKRMMTYFHDPRNLKFDIYTLHLSYISDIHVHQSFSINHLHSHLKFVFMPKMDTHQSKWALRPFGKPHLCHGRPS